LINRVCQLPKWHTGSRTACVLPYNNKVIKETTSDPPDLQRNAV